MIKFSYSQKKKAISLIISLQLTDILSGYEFIQRADLELRQKWRQPLLQTYTIQRSTYEQQITRYKILINRRKLVFRISLIMVALFLFTGFLLSILPLIFSGDAAWFTESLCVGPIILIIGVGIGIVVGGTYFYIPTPTKPNQPITPTSLYNQLVDPPLLERWLEGFNAGLKAKHPDDGYSGEVRFIRELEKSFPDMLILHRLVQKPGDDLDLVVIGNKGMWLFEVKYWKGSIVLENGEWRKSKKYRGRKGDEMTDIRKIEQPPQLQWQRMKNDLVYTLKRNMPEFDSKKKGMQTIKGGVVFTHPKSRFDIPKDAGFSWGNISFWLKQIQQAPFVPYYQNHANVFEILEILLQRHQQVEGSKKTKSMNLFAKELFDKANDELKTFIKNLG